MKHPCPRGLTLAVIQGLSKHGRLERTAPLNVVGLSVDRLPPPQNGFVVTARINTYPIKFNISEDALVTGADCTCKVGRCRLTVSKPVLKAPLVSALETIIS
jgi:hypothetical protein